MIYSQHKLSYCDLCETEMVICAVCGNNCCNGSDGKASKGIDCDCSEAYEHQKIYYENSANITFAGMIKSQSFKFDKQAVSN